MGSLAGESLGKLLVGNYDTKGFVFVLLHLLKKHLLEHLLREHVVVGRLLLVARILCDSVQTSLIVVIIYFCLTACATVVPPPK